VCWIAWCGAPRTNTLPLVYGMTPAEASAALGLPLTYYTGGRGNEMFYAIDDARIPGFYRTEFGIALQFRHGRLTGWKKDWRLLDNYPF
jgi:hypothetical protein